MRRVTPARPINLDRITVRRTADGWYGWVVYSPERMPHHRCELVLVDDCPIYRSWFYSWDFAWLKLDHWRRCGV